MTRLPDPAPGAPQAGGSPAPRSLCPAIGQRNARAIAVEAQRQLAAMLSAAAPLDGDRLAQLAERLATAGRWARWGRRKVAS